MKWRPSALTRIGPFTVAAATGVSPGPTAAASNAATSIRKDERWLMGSSRFGVVRESSRASWLTPPRFPHA
jgi:hypothetical protein